MNCSCQGRVGMELESGYPQSQRLLQPGHSDLAAHPSLGAHQGQVLAAPSHLLQSTREGGTWGKSLKEQLKFQVPPNTPCSGAKMQREQRLKLKTGSPKASTTILLQEQAQILPGKLWKLRHSFNLAPAGTEPWLLGKVSKARQAAPPTPPGLPEGLIASLVYLCKNSPCSPGGVQPPAARGCCSPRETERLGAPNKTLIIIVAVSLSCSSSSKGVHG